MKAAICTRYGPPEVLQLSEVTKPKPKDDELLIKIVASNVFPGDCELRRFEVHPFFWLPIRLATGILKPRKNVNVLGQEYSGVVQAVGSKVTDFKPGDRVYAPTFFGGTYAEYIRTKIKNVQRKPDNLSFEEAAAVCVGGSNALHFLRKGEVNAGQHVLLYGAGGSIGTMAIQIAKAIGAEVTAIDSGNKLDALRAIGADHVIDYTQEDFTKNGKLYDVIIDMPGKSNYTESLQSLKSGGFYILGNASALQMLRSPWTSWCSDKTVKSVLAPYTQEYFDYLKELIQAGKLKPIIDRYFSLDQVVEAHRYVESGRKIGNVVLRIESEQ
jgi:NADPH:quinone reductase-like Zn-dependent oxidoreductase